jgi:hypothetical protein
VLAAPAQPFKQGSSRQQKVTINQCADVDCCLMLLDMLTV